MEAQFAVLSFLFSGEQVLQVLAGVVAALANVGADEAKLELRHGHVSVFLHIDDGREVHGHFSALSRGHDTVVFHLHAHFLSDGKLAQRLLRLPGVRGRFALTLLRCTTSAALLGSVVNGGRLHTREEDSYVGVV